MNEPVTAIVLAGGKSSRMGKNKLFLELDGVKFIDRVIHLLNPIFDEIIFISNTPGDFSGYQFKVYKDLFPFYGPLAGIHSGLVHSTTEYNFVISIDMPFVNHRLIEFLLENYKNFQITLPAEGNKIQPICGIYSRGIIHEMELLLKNANKKEDLPNEKINVKLFDLVNAVKTNLLNITSKEFYHEHLFFNVNTKEDYKRIVTIYNNIDKTKLI